MWRVSTPLFVWSDVQVGAGLVACLNTTVGMAKWVGVALWGPDGGCSGQHLLLNDTTLAAIRAAMGKLLDAAWVRHTTLAAINAAMGQSLDAGSHQGGHGSVTRRWRPAVYRVHEPGGHGSVATDNSLAAMV